MSADNWTICPQCAGRAQLAADLRKQEVGRAYGNVSADEYLRMFNEAKEEKPLDQTLREDYSIGVYGEEFSIEYSCHCGTCDFKFAYKFEQKLEINLLNDGKSKARKPKQTEAKP